MRKIKKQDEINLKTPHFDHTFYAKQSENGSLLLFINQQYKKNYFFKNELESIIPNCLKIFLRIYRK